MQDDTDDFAYILNREDKTSHWKIFNGPDEISNYQRNLDSDERLGIEAHRSPSQSQAASDT